MMDLFAEIGEIIGQHVTHTKKTTRKKTDTQPSHLMATLFAVTPSLLHARSSVWNVSTINVLACPSSLHASATCCMSMPSGSFFHVVPTASTHKRMVVPALTGQVRWATKKVNRDSLCTASL